MYSLLFITAATASSEAAEAVETGWNTSNVVTLVAAIIAAVVSIIGLFVQIYLNKKAIKADVVSKSRIEWNSELREITSGITHLSFMISRILSTYLNENNTIRMAQKNIKSISPLYSNDELIKITTLSSLKLSEEFDLLIEDFTKKGYHFELLFGINERNQKLINSLNAVNVSLNKMVKIREDFQKGSVKIEDSIIIFNSESDKLGNTVSHFQEEVRIYLKEEWIQIKKGK